MSDMERARGIVRAALGTILGRGYEIEYAVSDYKAAIKQTATALAAARREALEDAAKVADEIHDATWTKVFQRGGNQGVANLRVKPCTEIAAAIRALKDQP